MKTMFLVGYLKKDCSNEIPVIGIYENELIAINQCNKENFILEFKINSLIPQKIEDCIKLYYPKLESWERVKTL